MPASQPPPPSDPVPTPGSERARGLLQAAVTYLEARAQLFQIEAKEAASGFSRVASAGAIGGFAFAIAWLIAMPAAISLASAKFGVAWEYLALGVAGIHLFFGFIFLIVSRSRARGLKPFEESINQFKEDRTWLGQNRPQK